jgi:hypothetical protein
MQPWIGKIDAAGPAVVGVWRQVPSALAINMRSAQSPA